MVRTRSLIERVTNGFAQAVVRVYWYAEVMNSEQSSFLILQQGTDAQPYFRVFNPYLQAEKVWEPLHRDFPLTCYRPIRRESSSGITSLSWRVCTEKVSYLFVQEIGLISV